MLLYPVHHKIHAFPNPQHSLKAEIRRSPISLEQHECIGNVAFIRTAMTKMDVEITWKAKRGNCSQPVINFKRCLSCRSGASWIPILGFH